MVFLMVLPVLALEPSQYSLYLSVSLPFRGDTDMYRHCSGLMAETGWLFSTQDKVS